jgi:hypothetical protein
MRSKSSRFALFPKAVLPKREMREDRGMLKLIAVSLLAIKMLMGPSLCACRLAQTLPSPVKAQGPGQSELATHCHCCHTEVSFPNSLPIAPTAPIEDCPCEKSHTSDLLPSSTVVQNFDLLVDSHDIPSALDTVVDLLDAGTVANNYSLSAHLAQRDHRTPGERLILFSLLLC